MLRARNSLVPFFLYPAYDFPCLGIVKSKVWLPGIRRTMPVPGILYAIIKAADSFVCLSRAGSIMAPVAGV